MPRKKAKPTRIVKLDYGSAHTEKARYATREDRHFSFNLGGADDFRDGAFYLVGVIDGHRGAACAEEVARFLPSVIGSGSSFQDAFAHMDRVVTADAFQERSGEPKGGPQAPPRAPKIRKKQEEVPKIKM